MKSDPCGDCISRPIAGTLVDVVRQRAITDAGKIAYTFLADGAGDARSITWGQLDLRARRLAAALAQRGGAGQPVLLALPTGLAFVEALFGCWYAGAVAAPISLPRHRRVKHRLHQVVGDAGARFVFSTDDIRERLEESFSQEAATAKLNWIDAAGGAAVPEGTAPESEPATARPNPADVALLQYTSGSTGAPRGVVITHSNIMRNSALIAEACGHTSSDTIAGWLPLFHDMGLVGGIFQTAYTGARCVLMSPERFLMRPWLWLKMLSDFKACSSPAPNFAYDLCVEKVDAGQKASLDLSGWRNALNGSEPVRAATLDRFARAFECCGFQRSAFLPCYGLAEATLFVAGAGADRRLINRTADGTLIGDGASGHVGCGQTFGDTELALVDPATCQRVPPGKVGEIWVAGESVAQGYWNNPQATAATFRGQIRSAGGEAADATRWLRTGDLGFVAEGQLFITGRLRELIKIAGRNHFPIDLERTAESADPSIATSGAAAIGVDAGRVERLVIVAELRRDLARAGRGGTGAAATDVEGICRRVRAAIAAEHDVSPDEVVLLNPGALPRVTSGKISRRSTLDAYLNHTLERFEEAHAHATL